MAGGKDCPGGLADGGKVIVLLPETDVEGGGYAERDDQADYRVIEIAGVSHIPSSCRRLPESRHARTEPSGIRTGVPSSACRPAGMAEGTRAPAQHRLDLSDAPPRNWRGAAVRAAARDADGNAKGGVRLPHMPTVLDNGAKAGAPLGHYTGFARDYEKSNMFFTISGTFTPFANEKLRALYSNRDAYVSAVSLAAKDLVAKRYILQEDADAYIEGGRLGPISGSRHSSPSHRSECIRKTHRRVAVESVPECNWSNSTSSRQDLRLCN